MEFHRATGKKFDLQFGSLDCKGRSSQPAEADDRRGIYDLKQFELKVLQSLQRCWIIDFPPCLPPHALAINFIIILFFPGRTAVYIGWDGGVAASAKSVCRWIIVFATTNLYLGYAPSRPIHHRDLYNLRILHESLRNVLLCYWRNSWELRYKKLLRHEDDCLARPPVPQAHRPTDRQSVAV